MPSKTQSLSAARRPAALSEGFGALRELRLLDSSFCDALASLLASHSALTALKDLSLKASGLLAALPDAFEPLVRLQDLDLCGCRRPAALSETLRQVRGLRALI